MLKALASRIEASLEDYDSKARDIDSWLHFAVPVSEDTHKETSWRLHDSTCGYAVRAASRWIR